MLNYAYSVKIDSFEVYCFDENLNFFQPIIFTCSQPNNTTNLVVNVTDSAGGLTYSLDGVTYQASNAFADQEEGLKTVYVKDSANTINSRTFTISNIDV